jgi:hypothetical protein
MSEQHYAGCETASPTISVVGLGVCAVSLVYALLQGAIRERLTAPLLRDEVQAKEELAATGERLRKAVQAYRRSHKRPIVRIGFFRRATIVRLAQPTSLNFPSLVSLAEDFCLPYCEMSVDRINRIRENGLGLRFSSALTYPEKFCVRLVVNGLPFSSCFMIRDSSVNSQTRSSRLWEDANGNRIYSCDAISQFMQRRLKSDTSKWISSHPHNQLYQWTMTLTGRYSECWTLDKCQFSLTLDGLHLLVENGGLRYTTGNSHCAKGRFSTIQSCQAPILFTDGWHEVFTKLRSKELCKQVYSYNANSFCMMTCIGAMYFC